MQFPSQPIRMWDLGRARGVNASRVWLPDPELLRCSCCHHSGGNGVWASERSCGFWHGFFGGWFYLPLCARGCRVFACSGFGFLRVSMLGFFVCFFLSAVAPHLGFPPFLQKPHYNNHFLNCAWQGTPPAGGWCSLVANKPCLPRVHWPSPEQT